MQQALLNRSRGLVMRSEARTGRRAVARAPASLALGRQTVVPVRASTLTPRNPNSNEEGSAERAQPGFSPMMGVPNVTMAGGNFGSGGSMGATMERSKLNFVMPTPVVQGPKLDDGGSGGDIGKNNRNGGGGGGGDDDDDDYFNGEDGDEEGGEGGARGDGFFRAAILESYDKFSIGAVLAEWMKTIQELPAILRQAATMGLFSSAQLVRFFAMDVRPNVTRAISRRLPPSLAREFIGRLMADPGFVQKMVLESVFASGASLWYEYRLRGDKFKEEADLVLINTLGFAAATAATVWLLAPTRSYGTIQKFPWQQMLDGLPNCVFDASGPLRSYSKQARVAGFVAKMAELSAVGAFMGTVTSLLSGAAVAVRRRSDPEWQPSTPVPGLGRSSAGTAAFFALNANTRYQLVGGLDRFLFDRTTFLWTYVFLSGAARLASNQVGEVSRAWWQGLPAPASLAPGPNLIPAPMLPRRVKKKVSKRVPRSQVAAKQAAAAETQAQLEGTAVPAAMAALAVSAGSLADAVVPLETTLQELQGPGVPVPEPVSAVADDSMVGRAEAVQGTGSGVQAAVRVQGVSVSGQAAGGPGPAAAAVAVTSEGEDEEDDEESGSEGSEAAAPVPVPAGGRASYMQRH